VETREWLKTVEAFFREKNRAWLSGEEETLLHFLAGTPNDCHSWQEVRAMRESFRHRQARCRKVKTNLRILAASWQQEREQMVVDAVEDVRFYYEQGGRMEHESRRTRHQIRLMPVSSQWRLVSDETQRESREIAQAPSDQEALAVLGTAAGEKAGAQMRGRYDRIKAYKYAELWWNGFNPAYREMKGNDCTNYISQVLHAGGMPMVNTGAKGSGWWYRGGSSPSWSYSWTVAHSLRFALSKYMQAREVSDPRQLKVGDVICYDWDGDGRWQHNTVVVDFDRSGMPLVNAHTIASHRRYWDYRDSYAYTPSTRYAFYHIPDTV